MINEEIEKLNWNKEPRGLYQPIGYTLQAGGKRLRPTLALLACSMFDGKEKDVLPVALALEVFHNFTLLHDDLMDHSHLRRGRETVWCKWNEATAVLSGDQMLIEAYKLLSRVKSQFLGETLRQFNKMATEICEGQQYDMDFETNSNVRLEDYIEMIRLKTSVLLATALRLGAYIGGADEEQQQALYDFGIHVGLAFQIQDDILDVYGTEETLGKPIGGDIREGKKTYLYLMALAAATDAEKEVLNSRDVAAVTALYDRMGVRKACEDVMAGHTRLALALLGQLPKGEAADQLAALAEKLLKRNN